MSSASRCRNTLKRSVYNWNSSRKDSPFSVMVHTAVKTMQTCSLLQFSYFNEIRGKPHLLSLRKVSAETDFSYGESYSLWGWFDSWIKVFHLKVSLRFEDGIVETNSAIYECNYVLIVGRYVVFLGNVWSYQTRSHYMKRVNIKKRWENERII